MANNEINAAARSTHLAGRLGSLEMRYNKFLELLTAFETGFRIVPGRGHYDIPRLYLSSHPAFTMFKPRMLVWHGRTWMIVRKTRYILSLCSTVLIGNKDESVLRDYALLFKPCRQGQPWFVSYDNLSNTRRGVDNDREAEESSPVSNFPVTRNQMK